MAKTLRSHKYRNYTNSLSQWVLVSYGPRRMHLIWIEAKEELWSTISIAHPLKEQWVWTAPRPEHLLWALDFIFVFKKRPLNVFLLFLCLVLGLQAHLQRSCLHTLVRRSLKKVNTRQAQASSVPAFMNASVWVYCYPTSFLLQRASKGVCRWMERMGTRQRMRQRASKFISAKQV